MLVTDSPCEHCAGLIINTTRVDTVVYGRQYRDPAGLERLTRRGVLAVKWPGEVYDAANG